MNILISKSDALGDQILAAGLVTALRGAHPSARLFWHVRAGMEVIGQLLPDCCSFAPDPARAPAQEAERLFSETNQPLVLLVFPINPYLLTFPPDLESALKWWRDFLARLPIDLAVAPLISRNWLSDFTVAASRAPRRVGFAMNPTCQPMISTARRLLDEAGAAPLFTEEVQADLARSELQNLGALAAHLTSSEPALHPPKLSPPAAAKAEAQNRWSLPSKPLILFAPGVGQDRKRAWPLPRFLDVANSLPAGDYEIRWLCGPLDHAFFSDFPEHLKDRMISYSADDFGLLAALLTRARCLVCNDTSLAHLAAALNTPTVAVFASAHGDRFIPAPGSVKVVQADIACRGCQWHCLFEDYACVKNISAAAVREALQDVLLRNDVSTRRVPMPLDTLLGHPVADEHEWVRTAVQRKLVSQHWDGWARGLAIQELEGKWSASDARGNELHRRLEKLNAATRNPGAFFRFLWRRFVRHEPL